MTSRHLAVCSWSLKPQNPSDLITSCGLCGIKSVQLALLPLIHEEQWADCSAMLQSEDMTVISGMLEASGEDYTSLETIAKTGGLRQDAMWSSTKENATQVAGIAEQMGLPLVTFHAGFIPETACAERTKMLERLQTLADIFEKGGVLLGLETGQECASNVVSVLEELSHPCLGVNYDPANMILYGKGDPIEAIKTLAPWVQQVHIKDAKVTEQQGTWGTEMPAGEGDVPWKEFLECVPDGSNLVIEREGGDNRIKDVQQAKTMLKELGVC
jgi:L-ribulose-5-phosphate 3-epimerase